MHRIDHAWQCEERKHSTRWRAQRDRDENIGFAGAERSSLDFNGCLHNCIFFSSCKISLLRRYARLMADSASTMTSPIDLLLLDMNVSTGHFFMLTLNPPEAEGMSGFQP
jgi:hypothetical protein